MKNLFIFDCFGVLVTDITAQWFAQVFGERGAELKQHYFELGADTSGVTVEEIAEQIAREQHLPLQQVKAQWRALVQVNTELLQFIDALRTRHRAALLTNAPRNVSAFFEGWDVLSHFDKVLVSGEVGIRKPQKEFYRMCIDAFDEPFAHVYMIDDNPRNLRPCPELGIVPLQFTTNAALLAELKSV